MDCVVSWVKCQLTNVLDIFWFAATCSVKPASSRMFETQVEEKERHV